MENISGVPEMFSGVPKMVFTLPEMFSALPEMFFTLPEMVFTLPEMFFTLPENISGTPEMFLGVPENISGSAEIISVCISDRENPVFDRNKYSTDSFTNRLPTVKKYCYLYTTNYKI